MMQDPVALTADQLDQIIGDLVSNYRFVDIRNIEQFTNNLCAAFKLTGIPRDPWCILPEAFGIELRRVPPDRPLGAPAQWQRDHERNRYVIEVSEQWLGHKGSIAIIHEFWEIITSNVRFPTRYGSNQECELGDKFAVYFLMPEDAVRDLCKELGHPYYQNKSVVMADRLCASIRSLERRLEELGLGYKQYQMMKKYGPKDEKNVLPPRLREKSA